MEKQTAVEWLIEQWPILESQLPPQLIEQAKKMEEEQNQLWWSKGWQEGHLSTLQENTETFKSE
jgi:hypothetical protein